MILKFILSVLRRIFSINALKNELSEIVIARFLRLNGAEWKSFAKNSAEK